MNAIGPKERATFSLSPAVKARLEEVVPKNERSRFVEKAVADALRREALDQLKQTLDSMQGYSSGGEDSVELLRRLRSEREAYLAERHGL